MLNLRSALNQRSNVATSIEVLGHIENLDITSFHHNIEIATRIYFTKFKLPDFFECNVISSIFHENITRKNS